MRKAYHPKVRFFIGKVEGYFTDNGWHNQLSTLFYKKTDAWAAANQIIQAEGQVYIRVSLGKGFYNDGIYSNADDCKKAFSNFTEKSLIDFAGGVS